MRYPLVALLPLIVAGCAGSRPVPDEEPGAVPVPEETEEAPPAGGPAVAVPVEPGYEPAPDEPATEEPEEPEAIPEDESGAGEPQGTVDLPPQGEETWVAPEIRTLAEALQQAEVPPSAVYYVGGTNAAGCMELYTFRFYYGERTRYADVAGFERLTDAEECQQLVEQRGGLVPDRIGVFLVDFSDEVAGEMEIRRSVVDGVGNLPVGKATPIPKATTPFGAEPGTVVRKRQPPPAG
ncbi:hypothetical protein [Vulgatibacter sp.]|uniref:hypothetical protein n=1 Tax=Vulgatibacter sp. TaxID=1971226 RepID=UPI003561EE8D